MFNFNRKKIISYLKSSANSFFANSSGSYILNNIKNSTLDILSIFISFFKIIKLSINFLQINLLDSFKIIVMLKSKKIHATINNFKIGKEMLKEGSLSDAIFRFWLADKFSEKKSFVIKYYLAYTKYLQGRYKESLLYIKQALEIRPNSKLLQKLFTMIENDIKSFKL
jgi:hypothetical protein